MPTVNMNLDLPTVSSTIGPEWASLLNAALELVDAHDHSSGKGAKVTPAGISINAVLDMSNQGATDATYYQMRSKSFAETSSAALGSIQVIDNDLYFVNSASQRIQLTDNSNIFNPGGRLSYKAAPSTSYTVLQTDLANVIACNTTSSSYTITLPDASDGVLYCYVKDIAGNAVTNNITINGSGGQTIDGESSQVIDYNYGMLGFISDVSSNWYVI